MKVITLNSSDFHSACQRLINSVKQQGITYDTVVGIATGGDYVAAEFNFGDTYSIRKQRPSTSSKQGLVSKILPHLPVWLLNMLRIAEAKWLARNYDKLSAERIKPTVLPDDLRRKLLSGHCHDVLVTDDAVDSGSTLLSVVMAIHEAAPGVHIHTAVLTVTSDNPVIQPDVALWRNRTLIRFPWSIDTKS